MKILALKINNFYNKNSIKFNCLKIYKRNLFENILTIKFYKKIKENNHLI